MIEAIEFQAAQALMQKYNSSRAMIIKVVFNFPQSEFSSKYF